MPILQIILHWKTAIRIKGQGFLLCPGWRPVSLHLRSLVTPRWQNTNKSNAARWWHWWWLTQSTPSILAALQRRPGGQSSCPGAAPSPVCFPLPCSDHGQQLTEEHTAEIMEASSLLIKMVMAPSHLNNLELSGGQWIKAQRPLNCRILSTKWRLMGMASLMSQIFLVWQLGGKFKDADGKEGIHEIVFDKERYGHPVQQNCITSGLRKKNNRWRCRSNDQRNRQWWKWTQKLWKISAHNDYKMKTYCGSLNENGPHRLIVWMLGPQLMEPFVNG